jgi:transposase
MSKHKNEDYKITAVKYYLENDTNYTKTCEIFKCSERSLKRWIERYEHYPKERYGKPHTLKKN